MSMAALWMLGGTLMVLYRPAGLEPAVPLAFGLMLVMACCSVRRLRPGLWGIVGCGCASLATLTPPQGGVPPGERMRVQAHIESVPVVTEHGWQFVAAITPPPQSGVLPVRVRLDFPVGTGVPRADDRWQLVVQFSGTAARDTGYQRTLWREGIAATGQVRPSPLNRRLAAGSAGINHWREKVAMRIVHRVADPATAGLLSALAVGVTGDVSRDQWRVFNATGITHLVAISGLHVTFFALLTMRLARWLWRRSTTLQSCLRREAFASGFGVLLALGYALLSGFSVPAQRTVIMLTAFLWAQQAGRVARPFWSVAVALVVVLLYDATAALSAGFWLSFGAVSAIVMIAGAAFFTGENLHAAARVQWVVTVALLPVTVAIFGTFAALGPLVNALAIPLFTLALVPPILCATLLCLLPGTAMAWCADHLFDVTGWLATGLWPVLARCADAASALWFANAPLVWYPLAAAGAVVLLLPMARTLRWLAGVCLLSVFWAQPLRPDPAELWIDVLDVGASSAVLLRTRHHQILSGVGESFASAGRRFEARVLPRLRSGGFRQLDLLLLGRASRDDHAALTLGAALLHVARVETAASSEHAPEIHSCEPRRWHWDGVEFELLRAEQASDCLLVARAASRMVLVALTADGRTSPAVAASGANPDMVILPRRREAAATWLAAAAGQPVMLASMAAREWNSAGWTALRHSGAARRETLWSTATQGTMQWRITPAGQLLRRPDPHEFGL
jgi:competence protein ComEC